MSKFVKELITLDLRKRLEGVESALLVSVAGMDANKNNRLRLSLQAQNIDLVVLKNSLARRATEGTPLAAAFEQMEGSLALAFGGPDIVSLAKVITGLAADKQFAPFEARGGVMDGARLTAEQVKLVSKWPSREEQLSILVGQILSPGAKLASQLTSAGGALASQIKEKAKGADDAAANDATAGESTPAEAASAPASSGEPVASEPGSGAAEAAS